ncbi:MAG: trypsin-like serine protease [Alphaproteobacteria bacterium]|nr:trypsin-like serine protease [Alphaproteobacteria bacterium]
MCYYLSIFLFLLNILSFPIIASEEFEDYSLLTLTDHYQPDQPGKISLLETSELGRHTLPHPGEELRLAHTGDILLYDKDSPTFIPMRGEDGQYEFIEAKGQEKGKEKKLERKEEVGLIGSMSKLKAKKVTNLPYRYCGNLLMTFPHSENEEEVPAKCVGSGVLVGPNHVLTAAHNLFSHKRGGWATEVIFTPAQCKTMKPFGEVKGVLLRSFKGWIDGKGEGYDHDMGLIILERAIGYQIGWAGLLEPESSFLASSPRLKIVGYPSKGVKVKLQEGIAKIKAAQMYKHSGHIKESQEQRFLYEIETAPGQSGGPLLAYNMDNHYVVGVHTYGLYEESKKERVSEGTRLTSNKLECILEGINRFMLRRNKQDCDTISDFFTIELDDSLPSLIEKGSTSQLSEKQRGDTSKKGKEKEGIKASKKLVSPDSINVCKFSSFSLSPHIPDEHIISQCYESGKKYLDDKQVEVAAKFFRSAVLVSISSPTSDKGQFTTLHPSAESSLILLINIFREKKDACAALIWCLLNNQYKRLAKKGKESNSRSPSQEITLSTSNKDEKNNENIEIIRNPAKLSNYFNGLDSIELSWEQIKREVKSANTDDQIAPIIARLIAQSSQWVKSNLKLNDTSRCLQVIRHIIKENPHIQSVNLRDNNLKKEQCIKYFISHISNSLISIDLDGNKFDNKCIQIIAKANKDREKPIPIISFGNINNNASEEMESDGELIKSELSEEESTKNKLSGKELIDALLSMEYKNPSLNNLVLMG